MKYGFYISGKSGRLTKALKQFSESLKKEIVVVISDCEIEINLRTLLQRNNIKFEVINDKKLTGTRKEKNLIISNFILEKLLENEAEYMISYGSHLLRGDLLEKYNYRLINFHPSILPMFPGIKAIDQAINFGNVLLVGNTAHFIDAGTDTGTIIMQSVIPVKAFDDTSDYDVILDLQVEMLNKLLKIIDEERLRIINGKAIIEGADYKKSNIYPYVC